MASSPICTISYQCTSDLSFSRCLGPRRTEAIDSYTLCCREDEIVTPHQTTLLKLVDSYLQSMATVTSATPEMTMIRDELTPMLSSCFFVLSTYTQRAIREALGPSTSNIDSLTANPSPPAPGCVSVKQPGSTVESPRLSQPPFPPQHPVKLDVILPKVWEALVLVTQCIISITLEAEGQGRDQDEDSTTPSINPSNKMRQFFNGQRSSNQGMAEHLIRKCASPAPPSPRP